MKKRENAAGMHEIESKRRPCAVKDKKSGVRLRTKRRMSRTGKAVLTLFLCTLLGAGVYGVGSAFFKAPTYNVVNLDYGSPSTPVEEGEVYSLGAEYTGVEIFARLNWTFAQQTNWYGEMHGIVNAVGLLTQNVSTYKQYHDGILISADLTESSMITDASQFCYLRDRDRVMWRKPANKNFNGMQTKWQTGVPYKNMTIGGANGFKATRGLPAYELSVYVIDDDTVLRAYEPTQSEDGLFHITYELNPKNWQEEDENGVLVTKGATAYYINQMMFTGGLNTPPEFDSLTVSFTFDENWHALRTDIEEHYRAKYGPIAAPCSSTSYTDFTYNTDLAYSPDYENYFAQYINDEITNDEPEVKEITALDCLADAFGGVLTGPSILNVDLTVNGEEIAGVVDLDLGGADISALDLAAIEAKARLGTLRLWLDRGTVYLSYGGMKVSAGTEELLSLIGGGAATAAETEGVDGGGDLLSALANGEFIQKEGGAELHSVLPLFGLQIPVHFYFNIDEDRTITLDRVTTSLSLSDLSVSAVLTFGDEELPALTAEDKACYAELVPYAKTVLELLSAEQLHADIAYEGEGVSLSGGIELDRKDYAVTGTLKAGVERDGLAFEKSLTFSYLEGKVYLDIEGVRLVASAEDAIALIERTVGLPEMPDTEVTVDLGELLHSLFTPEFASLFASSEEDGVLSLAIRGTELLQAFGVEFGVGEVALSVGEGSVGVAALGASVTLSEGEPFVCDTDGYADILRYANAVLALIEGRYLRANVLYNGTDIHAEGTVDFDIESLEAMASLDLQYKDISKHLDVIYSEETLYLELDGIKVKAGVNDAIELVSRYVDIPKQEIDAQKLLNDILAMDLRDLITVKEAEGTLGLVIAGDTLLGMLGTDLGFEVGQVDLKITDTSISASAAGAEIELTKGAPLTYSKDGYADILRYANAVLALIEGRYLRADVLYNGTDLHVEGTVDFDIESLEAMASLDLQYNDISKHLDVIYSDETLYLELEGIKVKAGIEDAVELVSRYVDIPEQEFDAQKLLKDILSMDLRDLITVKEAEGTLGLAIAGDTLLKLFDADLGFALGSVDLKITDTSISASAAGSEIKLTKGAPLTYSKDGYADILRYANAVLALIEGRYLRADVLYNGTDFHVDGTVDFDIESLEAMASLDLQYKDISKHLNIIYSEETLYLELDGIKVKAGIEDAVELVSRYVDIPEQEFDAQKLLKDILAMDLRDLITVKEGEGTLGLAIAGDTLLKLFDADLGFALGSVDLKITDTSISASAAGAEIKLTKGAPLTYSKDGYADILRYANAVLALIEGRYLRADVLYNGTDLHVDGTVDFDIESLEAMASLNLRYNDISKHLDVIYSEEVLYLELDGIKVKAGVNDAIKLVKKFVELPDLDIEKLVHDILSTDFGKLVELGETGDGLSAVVRVSELLALLKLDLGLGEEDGIGDANVTVTDDAILLAMSGLDVSIGTGSPLSYSTADYIDIVQYANTIADLLLGGAIHVDLTFEKELKGETLSAIGGVDLNFDLNSKKPTLLVSAELTLRYGKLEKTVKIVYATETIDGVEKGYLYLTLDGIKVKTDTATALGILADLMNTEGGETNYLESLLALDFSKVFKLTEEVQGEPDGSVRRLKLSVAGKELLAAFGVKFDLGSIGLTVGEGELAAEVYGARLSVRAGGKLSPDVTGFVDVTPVLKQLPALFEAKAISLYGGLELTAGDVQLALEIEEGAISFRDGLQLYVHATLSVRDAILELYLGFDGKTVRVAYGNVGAELTVVSEEAGETDIDALLSALGGLYSRIYDIVQSTLTPESENPLPLFDDLLARIKGGEVLGGLLGGESPDWTELVMDLLLRSSVYRNGIFGADFGDYSIDLIDETAAGRLLGVKVTTSAEASGTTAVSADLHASVLEGDLPAMPDMSYLTRADFVEMLDFVGAAAGLAERDTLRNLGLSFNGNIPADDGSVRYRYGGSVAFNGGAGYPLVLDTNAAGGKSLRAATDIFARIDFSLEAQTEADKSMYISVVVVNSDLNGAKNEYLDFYVTVSTEGPDSAIYDPLRVYIPGDELMTIVAGLVEMLGVDVEVVNEYFVRPWLSLFGTEEESKEIVARLKALGGGLLALIPSADEILPEEGEPRKKDYIKDLTVTDGDEGEKRLRLLLSGDALKGEGADDIELLMAKTGTAGSSLLSSLSVQSVGAKSSTTILNLSVDTATKVDTAWGAQAVYPADGGYFDVQGVEKLIVALARSVTHLATDAETSGKDPLAGKGEYLLNRNFYIDGTASLRLHLGDWQVKEIVIKDLAVSVDLDSNGKPIINAHFAVDALRMTLAGLLGDSVIIKGDTALDITIANNMLYMKRVQTTHFENTTERDLPVPETLYRVLPLENFMKGDDYLDQICFMFNFSEKLMTEIMNLAGGGTGTGGAAEKKDIGATFKQYVKSCSLALTDRDNMRFTLNVNGQGLTGSSSFADIPVVLGVEHGFLRSIDADMEIASAVSISARLRYRNPDARMDDGVTNDLRSIASALESGMSKKLSEVVWTETAYLEGQFTTVRYMYESNVIGTQDVVFDPATKELYADLSYPDLGKYFETAPDGYIPVWDKPSAGSFEANMVIYARNQPKHFTLVFKSKYPVDGFTQEGEEYVLRQEWVYGTKLVFPEGEYMGKRIAGFRCPNGSLHKNGDNTWHIYDDEEVVFTAEWEDILYTAKFLVDGKVRETRSGYYGEELVLPDLTPEKEGYTFEGWGEVPSAFYANGTYEAVFKPQTFLVTLESEHEVNGDFVFEGGKYVYTFEFTYDSSVALPKNIKDLTHRLNLNGWKFAEGDGVYTSMPNVTSPVTMYAVWEPIGVDVRFYDVDGGLYSVENYREGVLLSEVKLPEVPERKGYTGEWQIAEGQTAEEGLEIHPVYEGIVYIIYEFSLHYIEGFDTVIPDEPISDPFAGTVERYYLKRIEYQFGSGGRNLTLGDSTSVRGKDFAGYYNERFGEGSARIDRITDEVIANVFGYNVGDSALHDEQNTLYVYWEDNTVTVHLYSDFEFEHASKDESGYYISYTAYDHETSIEGIELLPDSRDLTQIGWWYEDADGKWRKVTDIAEFVDEDREGEPVKLFALWMEHIRVNVTGVDANSLSIFGTTYNIRGSVHGGTIYGSQSALIYASAFNKEKENKTVQFVAYSDSGTRDVLDGGDASAIPDNGTFDSGVLTSATLGAFGDRLAYAGVEMTKTFYYTDENGAEQSYSTSWSGVVSRDEYDVRVYGKDGDLLKTDKVRADCPFDGDDNAIYVTDIVNGNAIYGYAAVELDQRTGYDASWLPSVDSPITGETEIHPNYIARRYEVKFRSELLIAGWTAGEDGLYTTTAFMYYDSVIKVTAGSRSWQYTVGIGSVIDLPSAEALRLGERDATWNAPSITANGATFTASYPPDTVVYKSVVPYSYGGASYSESSPYQTEYSSNCAPIEPAAAGYTFFGWWTLGDDGAWSQVTELVIGEAVRTVELVALWMQNMKVSVTGSRNLSFFTYSYSLTGTIDAGGKFVGACADAGTYATVWRFYVSGSADSDASASNSSARAELFESTHTVSFNSGRQNYGHAAVYVEFTYGGVTLKSAEVHAYKSF